MDDKKLKVIIGGVLHDIGKVLFRASDGRNHSQSGYDFLKNEVMISESDILDQVRYHHGKEIASASIDNDSLAFITYLADNIAAGADRRELEAETEFGFDRNTPLDSIFNILNGNQQSAKHTTGMLDRASGINNPVNEEVSYDEAFYQKIRRDILDILKNLEYTDEYANSLLEVMEACLSYIPSSTSKKERADISLYDHMKLTAAIGSCLLSYATEHGISNLKEWVFSNDVYQKKIFCLLSIDLSGIQSFIYGQYGNKDVLKNLRARSFYLEIMLEEMIDELLDAVSLSRANVIYTGGGHAYLLLPHTENTVQQIREHEKKVNKWLLSVFDIELYAAFGYTDCSADELMNRPEGSYRDIFRHASAMLSEKKIKRYRADEIRLLNKRKMVDHERECRVCHRSDLLKDGDLCEICAGFHLLSGEILGKKFFSIVSTDYNAILPIFPDRYLVADTEKKLRDRMAKQPEYIRSYAKNEMYTGMYLSTKLWVGDYASADTLNDLVFAGSGIRRLGVLRADVDNLGEAFVNGFSSKYQTLSRSATLSRRLSQFFKLHINDILENGIYSLNGESTKRNAAIIYSGGDDVFIVGAWKDVLEFAVDLHQAFYNYSQGTLTLSAGFGVFKPTYPISYIARKTGALESFSKQLSGKDAITLFDQENRYHWDVFIQKVLGEKLQALIRFFSSTEDYGKNFLYHLLELMRNREEKINLARMAYLLARLEPDEKSEETLKEEYRIFSKWIYQWMKDEENARQTITAIYIYAYLIREGDQDETNG